MQHNNETSIAVTVIADLVPRDWATKQMHDACERSRRGVHSTEININSGIHPKDRINQQIESPVVTCIITHCSNEVKPPHDASVMLYRKRPSQISELLCIRELGKFSKPGNKPARFRTSQDSCQVLTKTGQTTTLIPRVITKLLLLRIPVVVSL